MRHGPSQDNLYVGAGIVMVEPFDADGVGLGLRRLGNVDAFSVTFEVDVLTKYSSMTRVKGLYAEIPRRVRSTFRMQSSEFIDETVRMAFLGTRARLVQAATAVTDEAVTTAITPGEEFIFRTAKLGPITGVSMKFNAVTGVLGTDYEILNADVGLIRIKPTTTKVGPVLVSYTPTAYTSTTGPTVISAGMQPIVKARILYVSDNLSGPNRMIEVWETSVRPDGAHDLISDDFGNIVLTGGVYDKSADHPTTPYFNDIWFGDALP
jgi:hypothetical protein